MARAQGLEASLIFVSQFSDIASLTETGRQSCAGGTWLWLYNLTLFLAKMEIWHMCRQLSLGVDPLANLRL